LYQILHYAIKSWRARIWKDSWRVNENYFWKAHKWEWQRRKLCVVRENLWHCRYERSRNAG